MLKIEQNNFSFTSILILLDTFNTTIQFKFGYTSPVRHPSLDESVDNYDKVVILQLYPFFDFFKILQTKNFGALLLDADEMCAKEGAQHFGLTAKFDKFDKMILHSLKMAGFVDGRLQCGKFERTGCMLKHEVRLYQVLYNCDGLQYRLPRVSGFAYYIYDNATNPYPYQWVRLISFGFSKWKQQVRMRKRQSLGIGFPKIFIFQIFPKTNISSRESKTRLKKNG